MTEKYTSGKDWDDPMRDMILIDKETGEIYSGKILPNAQDCMDMGFRYATPKILADLDGIRKLIEEGRLELAYLPK